jgi:hypothetical protein
MLSSTSLTDTNCLEQSKFSTKESSSRGTLRKLHYFYFSCGKDWWLIKRVKKDSINQNFGKNLHHNLGLVGCYSDNELSLVPYMAKKKKKKANVFL